MLVSHDALIWMIVAASVMVGMVVVGGGVWLLATVQEKLIFPARKMTPQERETFRTSRPGIAELALPVADGITLHGWWITPADAAPDAVVLYFGGNGDQISFNVSELAWQTGWQAVGVNYRGYGMSDGHPGEAALFADALKLYDHVAAQPGIRRIVLCGRSLGSGVAVYVASQRRADGIILVTPYDSVANVARTTYLLPIAHLIIRHPFDSLSRAPGITLPVLALLAEFDPTVPHKHTRRLLQAWGGPTTAHVIPGTNHATIGRQEGYWRHITDYLAALPTPAIS